MINYCDSNTLLLLNNQTGLNREKYLFYDATFPPSYIGLGRGVKRILYQPLLQKERFL